MATFFNKVIAFFMTLLTMMPWSGMAAKKNAENFRVVAYVVGNTFANAERIDDTHFSQVTDAILFGVATYDEQGEVTLAENFETVLENLRNAIGENKTRLHLNILGPGYTIQSDDWNEQMKDQSKHNNKAFASGKLEQNIKDVLVKYDFDGLFFDYEYPVTKADWKIFDKFIISLDDCLGDDFMLGSAISAWLTQQSREAINRLDFVELMTYDMWDDDGTHSSTVLTKCAVAEMLIRGYKREQIDLGLPFYARPTNHGAYWYDYGSYADKLDEKGFYLDPDTGLTFSFNDYDTIYEKTEWAVKFGLGGVMVWHYACDVPADNSLSLFNAIYKAKTDLM